MYAIVFSILDQYKASISRAPSSIPEDFILLVENVANLELSQYEQELRDLLELSDNAFKMAFIALYQKRLLANENSLLSYSNIPNGLTNQMFWDIGKIVLSKEELAAIHLQGVTTVLIPFVVENYPPETMPSEMKAMMRAPKVECQRMGLQAVIDELWELGPITLQKYVQHGTVLFSVPHLASIPFQSHVNLFRDLHRTDHKLAQAVYAHNNTTQILVQDIHYYLQKGQTPRQALESIAKIYATSGETYTRTRWAKKDTFFVRDAFLLYWESLPQILRTELETLRGKNCKLLAIVQMIYACACVETISIEIFVILQSSDYQAILNTLPIFTRRDVKALETKYGQYTSGNVPFNVDHSSMSKSLPGYLCAQILDRICINNFDSFFDFAWAYPSELLPALFQKFKTRFSALDEAETLFELITQNILGSEKTVILVEQCYQWLDDDPKYLVLFILQTKQLDFFKTNHHKKGHLLTHLISHGTSAQYKQDIIEHIAILLRGYQNDNERNDLVASLSLEIVDFALRIGLLETMLGCYSEPNILLMQLLLRPLHEHTDCAESYLNALIQAWPSKDFLIARVTLSQTLLMKIILTPELFDALCRKSESPQKLCEDLLKKCEILDVGISTIIRNTILTHYMLNSSETDEERLQLLIQMISTPNEAISSDISSIVIKSPGLISQLSAHFVKNPSQLVQLQHSPRLFAIILDTVLITATDTNSRNDLCNTYRVTNTETLSIIRQRFPGRQESKASISIEAIKNALRQALYDYRLLNTYIVSVSRFFTLRFNPDTHLDFVVQADKILNYYELIDYIEKYLDSREKYSSFKKAVTSQLIKLCNLDERCSFANLIAFLKTEHTEKVEFGFTDAKLSSFHHQRMTERALDLEQLRDATGRIESIRQLYESPLPQARINTPNIFRTAESIENFNTQRALIQQNLQLRGAGRHTNYPRSF